MFSLFLFYQRRKIQDYITLAIEHVPILLEKLIGKYAYFLKDKPQFSDGKKN